MKPLKVLNRYAGIGGNRKLWEDVEVTAVENNPEVAEIYQDFFPDDEVIFGDAHQYLLNHFKEFDFIWSSRPCTTHSKARFWGAKGGLTNPIYPDLVLYEEILFLRHYYTNGKWVVENVKPYYEPLISPNAEVGRHLVWSNFTIPKRKDDKSYDEYRNSIPALHSELGLNLTDISIKQKTKILRNCVPP